MRERGIEFPDKKRRADNLFGNSLVHLKRNQELRQEFDIGQREATVRLHGEYADLPVNIFLLTDPHFGSAGVDYDLLEQHLGIAYYNPNFFLVTNGDDVDNFNSAFFQQGMMETPMTPQMQGTAWQEMMRNFDSKGRLIGMSFGNHNDFSSVSGLDWYNTFLSEINAPVLTSGGLVHLEVGKQTYDLAMTHRHWGTSKLNPTNACKRFMEHEYPEADIFFLGHTHQSELLHFERGGKERVGVIGGTYKQDDKWARTKGIGRHPGQPGFVVSLYPNEKRMTVYKDIEVAAEMMGDMIYAHVNRDENWVDPYTKRNE